MLLMLQWPGKPAIRLPPPLLLLLWMQRAWGNALECARSFSSGATVTSDGVFGLCTLEDLFPALMRPQKRERETDTLYDLWCDCFRSGSTYQHAVAVVSRAPISIESPNIGLVVEFAVLHIQCCYCKYDAFNDG